MKTHICLDVAIVALTIAILGLVSVFAGIL